MVNTQTRISYKGFGKALLALAVVLFLFVFLLRTPDRAIDTYEASISTEKGTIDLLIADTEAERAQGLSGTPSLPENIGKLFIFETPGNYGFWMKEMNYPIDIVWIDKEWRVVGVSASVAPETYPQVFYPASAVSFVLEVNAGVAARLEIKEGSSLILKRNF